MDSKNKYLKYKDKYLNLKNQIGSAPTRSYDNMPINISVGDYYNLAKDEQVFYDKTNEKSDTSPLGFTIKYYSKLPKEQVEKNIKKTSLIDTSRLYSIQNTPNIYISLQEYDNLPPGKFGFEWVPVIDDSPYHEIGGYRKSRHIDQINAEKLSRLNSIQTTPNIKISLQEYYNLPPDKYGFEWVPELDDSPYHEINGYHKARSLAEVASTEAELNNTRQQILSKSIISSGEWSKLTYQQKQLYSGDITGLSSLEIYREAYKVYKKK